jgi:hypothetical protein
MDQIPEAYKDILGSSPKLSICYIAGCAFDFFEENGVYRIKTKYDINITPLGENNYLVVEKRQPERKVIVNLL